MADTTVDASLAAVLSSEITTDLGGLHYWRLTERERTKIRYAIWRVLDGNEDTRLAYRDAFVFYVESTPPPPPRAPLEFFDNLMGLTQVVLGGENNAVSCLPFGVKQDHPDELVFRAPHVRPAYLLDPNAYQIRTLLAICRKLANVMYVLKVFGNRFIRCDTLLGIFHHGLLGAATDPETRKIFKYINSFTADELWFTMEPGAGNMVVTKWSTFYIDEDERGNIALDDYYMQVQFV